MSNTADIIAKLGLDAKGFTSGIKDAQQQASGFANFGKSLKRDLAGLFSVGILTSFVSEMGQVTDKLQRASATTNMSTDALQALGFVAKQNGSSLDDVISATDNLTKAQGEGLRGQDRYVKKWQELGVSQKDLAELDTEALLQRIATRLHEGGYAGSSMSAAMTILGDGAAKLQPVLEDMANNGIGAMIARAKELGVVLDESMIATMDKAGDSLDAGKLKLQVWGSSLLDGLTKAATYLTYLYSSGIRLLSPQDSMIDAKYAKALLHGIDHASCSDIPSSFCSVVIK